MNELYDLIDRLLDVDKWPTYTNSKMLSELSEQASQAFSRDSFDGYLSYVLIAHQECEDYAILLLRHIQFTLRLLAVPSGFGWPAAKYEQTGVRENQMFGRILQMIEGSLEFECKREFIKACRRRNEIRNRLAHKLIEGITLDEIRYLAHEYKKGEESVIDSFNAADECFSWFYTNQAQELHWSQLAMQQIDSLEAEYDILRWRELLARLEKARVSTS